MYVGYMILYYGWAPPPHTHTRTLYIHEQCIACFMMHVLGHSLTTCEMLSHEFLTFQLFTERVYVYSFTNLPYAWQMCVVMLNLSAGWKSTLIWSNYCGHYLILLCTVCKCNHRRHFIPSYFSLLPLIFNCYSSSSTFCQRCIFDVWSIFSVYAVTMTPMW